MNRAIARAIHETTNATYWMEKPDWNTDNPITNFALLCLRKAPFSVHDFQKKHTFRNSELVTVSGESVVVDNNQTVKKYMFRYPGNMNVQVFHDNVKKEISAVTRTMATTALPTDISIEQATIFKRPFGSVEAVTQTQIKLDLISNPALTVNDLLSVPSKTFDSTANDLDVLLSNIDKLILDESYYPDIALSSSNLRKNMHTGNLTLIDVMPLHADGTRLIGDSPSKLPQTLETIEK